MELRTPEPETIEVTDLYFMFVGGIEFDLTLGPDDLTAHSVSGENLYTLSTGEEYLIMADKILYTCQRKRTVVKPTPALHPAVPPSATRQSSVAIDNLQVIPAAHTGLPR